MMAVLALLLLAYLLVFQLSLAAGAPLGRAAWGGRYTVLPTSLRLGSLISALIAVLGSLLVLERAGFVSLLGQPAWVSGGLIALAALFALSTVANLMSSSPWERYLGASIAALLSLSLALLVFAPAA